MQAGGRVFRTKNDIGVIHVMDDRYIDSKIKELLPKWWVISQ